MILEYVNKRIKHVNIFLAEPIFKFLNENGNSDNIIDIENELSTFADNIVIVLESESAFCELGAFAASTKVRGKIIVINDSKFSNDLSFINLGPIKAIKESAKRPQILNYKMDKDGKVHGDNIGLVYEPLRKLLEHDPKKRRVRVTEYNPNDYFNKESLKFVHDLIFISQPVYTRELEIIIKILFGTSNSARIGKHVGLLLATKQITRHNKKLKSNFDDYFYEYDGFDIEAAIVTFKNMYFKHQTARLL